MRLRSAALAAAVLMTAACGSSAHAPATGTAAANALVCQHYLAQRDHVKHLVQPTAADAEQFIADVAADAAQAAGKLRADLQAMYDDRMDAGRYYADSGRVLADCA